MPIHVFGIRHHGPGCARSLLAALAHLQPDVVVVEGPADAEEAIPLVANEGMKPPVALLVYPPDEPGRAAYYPLAEFSPEWQALRWGLDRGVPVRFMDLPQSIQIALRKVEEAAPPSDSEADPKSEVSPVGGTEGSADGEPQILQDEAPAWRTDPIAVLAEAAGFMDHELWWEEQVERRLDPTDLFAAIREAMAAVRAEFPETRPRDLLREAHMRRMLREVVRAGFQNIAVVCGAWHAPVLDDESVAGKRPGCSAKEDDALLKGLPKIKTAATWIPWTHSRLTYRSGYGAGVTSPGWYAHLWNSRERAPLRWIATAARLLREKDLDASSAGVIEAVRLADALAAMRELRSPGLTELNEAILSVLCRGEGAPMRLIRNRLEIGDVMGEVPEDTPAVPLAQDLARSQKSLRLKPASESRLLDLDLRNETDLARSHLLHRLRLLGIHWGELQKSGGKTSTFHEIWKLEWKPEFSVAVIEAGMWGTTVAEASAAKSLKDAETADLARITALLDAVILAGLNAAIDPLLQRIQTQAAVVADVRHLMHALPPLARVSRYGDVRGTQAAHVEPILVSMFERASIGLPSACSALDDDAAAEMLKGLDCVQQALDLVARTDLKTDWQAQLLKLADSGIHALLRGACCRLLLEQGRLSDEELYRRARLSLTPAIPPAECAAWATGLLRGSGLLLLHQEGIWLVFDRWLRELSSETFTEMLPLLRRAFSDFSPAERRQMGDKVKHLAEDGSAVKKSAKASSPAMVPTLHLERARRPLPVLAQILGVKYSPSRPHNGSGD